MRDTIVLEEIMCAHLLDRFLRYVRIDTQSKEDVTDYYPSTHKQKDLSALLLKELKDFGLDDASMDEYGYVTATLPSNLSEENNKGLPVLGFLAHVDTSPEVSGQGVNPIIHKNYQGGDIILPEDTTQIIKVEDNPYLMNCIGHDIITSDGTTLLGADDKAGIAEIVTMIDYFLQHPQIGHGTIRVGFTLDEEVGAGTKYFNVQKFNTAFAYTVDGEGVGSIEDETFHGAVAVFTIKGINVHPGYAKDKMINALRIAADIIYTLHKEPRPETTRNREGYLHPYILNGGVERVILKILIRDFEQEGMKIKADRLHLLRKQMNTRYPRARIDLDIKHQYENMLVSLKKDPRVVEYALEAVRRARIEPTRRFIRGGTDGAMLCSKGLLTPNIFTGGKNYHSTLEWISVQAMEKAVETLINLVQVWTEKSMMLS
ncbi:MAG: peptidase T [bacterium]